MTADLIDAHTTTIRRPLARTASTADQSAIVRFVRTPLAWVLIAIIVGAAAYEGTYREGNRRACASFSMLVDRQIWRDPINGRGPVVRFCNDLANPDTVGDM